MRFTRFSTTQTVFRLLLISMILVALIPVGLLGLHLQKTAWENSWREIREKHQLLAENLAAPIGVHVHDQRDALSLLVHFIERNDHRPESLQTLFDDSLDKLHGFSSLTYIDDAGNTVVMSHHLQGRLFSPRLFAEEKCFKKVKDTRAFFVSGIKTSPYSGKPTIMIGLPVFGARNELSGVLLGELHVELIEELRRNIQFGKRGHSAIVDQNGRVIAHPNTQWMREMKDLSDWPVVQAMMQGKKGVTEFYSPFIGQDMVAGYASIKETGWGIMVPQPKSEIEAQIRSLILSNYAWAIAGLVVAILIAIFMARWITRPLNHLEQASHKLIDNGLQGEIELPGRQTPDEIQYLGKALKSLVSSLQKSREEVKLLNRTLQKRVDEATEQLRQANKQLTRTVQIDYLTSLSNRRHFEAELEKLLKCETTQQLDNLCLMLIDIDNFKRINDEYGHAAGDVVLTQVAKVLESHMRPDDLVARYAGDEFVSRMRCSRSVALKRAEQIRHAVEVMAVQWQGHDISVSISVGLYCQTFTRDQDIGTVMHNVDLAMYRAKRSGRNRVEDYHRHQTMARL